KEDPSRPKDLSFEELKTEDQTGATDLKYKCKKCDRSFSKPKQEEQSKGLFHCSECGRRFMSNSALGSHKRWHKEKKFLRSSLKDDDLKSGIHKTEDGPFQCNVCGKQFFNHCVLQRHQMHSDAPTAVSSGDPNGLTCLECGTTFCQESDLHQHYIEHARGAY
uniref:C2H2-type domain-containing protein n=1 Tax=Lates calcarifer TaxID=8187 RepID=A0A4W6CR40_LATCA